MTITRKLLLLLALTPLLAGYCIPAARADDPALYDAFQKCDGLMGKSTKAVMDVLGQPDEANPVGDKTQPEHIIGWSYKSKTDFRQGLGLLFSPTKGLVVVTYSGLNNASGPGGKEDLNYLVRLLASYSTASLKVGFNDVDGTARTALHGAVIKATTPNGNLFRLFSSVHSPSLMIPKHTFNAAKGVYIDTFVPNPDFVISDFNVIGMAFLFSPRQLTNGNPDKLPPRWTAICYQAAQGSFALTKMTYIPLTSKIAPWMQPK